VARILTKRQAVAVIHKPRGVTTVKHSPGGTTVAKLDWNPDFSDYWSENYWAAQVWLDTQVLRLSAPYVPFLVGILEKSGTLGTVVGSGLVEYVTPYARYQYYRPSQTARELREGGMRGPMWFERMKTVHKNYLISGATERAGRGRGD